MSARRPRRVPVTAPAAVCLLLAACGAERGAPDASAGAAALVFHSERDGDRDIYRMELDGSGVTPVVRRPGSADFYPDLSPDGRSVVFTSAAADGRPGEIYLAGIDGAETVNLTNTPTSDDDWARWSPDGKRIVFHGDRGDGDYELYVMDVATRSVTPLVERTGADMWPDWSPDGRRIVFRQDRALAVMDLDTREVRTLATEGLNQMGAFSPDGQRIAFMSLRPGYCSVFVMNADGSDQVNLTPKAEGDPDDAWCSRAPSWTSDGRILFMSKRPGTMGPALFVMNAGGSGVRMLTDAEGEDGGPSGR